MAESQARRLMGAWAGEILPELGGGGVGLQLCDTRSWEGGASGPKR